MHESPDNAGAGYAAFGHCEGRDIDTAGCNAYPPCPQDPQWGRRQGVSSVEYRDLKTEQNFDLTRGQVSVYCAFRAQPDTAE